MCEAQLLQFDFIRKRLSGVLVYGQRSHARETRVSTIRSSGRMGSFKVLSTVYSRITR